MRGFADSLFNNSKKKKNLFDKSMDNGWEREMLSYTCE